jgi:hypothetical protein
MSRPLTALFAALEAVLVVGVGIGIPLVPLTVLWAVQFGFAADWGAFWRASVDVWLVGHGADLTIVLDDATSTALGLTAEHTGFPITIALLGFALLTLALGARAGRRVAETRYRLVGESTSVLTFAALATIVALTARVPGASPDLAQSIILPTLVFVAGIAIGSLRTRRAEGDEDGSSLRDWIDDWDPDTRRSVGAALRGAGAATTATLAAASVLLAICLAAGYARIISLYESLHTEVLGGIAVTLGQLALLPNLVAWTASWLVGPGFAIGSGSSVGPLGTALGPVPAVPVLGALPEGELGWGFLGLLVPVLAGFLAAVLVRPTLAESSPRRLVLVGVGIGVVAGVLLGLLAWFSAGSAGPGRLVEVGPNPLLVAAWAALEIGAAAVVGLLVTGRSRGPTA